jgi:hypothetical protein
MRTIAKPELHPLARQHLRELRERWGVEPTLEEAIWIVELCGRVLNPHTEDRADLAGIPQRCGAGDVWLWPPTVGSSVWYQELACGWWAGEPERLFWALAFALAHARDGETLRACRTREAAAGMIREWSLGLGCTREELEDGLDRVLPPCPDEAERKAARGAAMDWGRLVAEIESASGLPAEHWVWRVSRTHTLLAWHAARQLAAAQGGRAAPGAPDPADEAVQALAAAKAAIIRRAQAEGGAK